MHTLPPSYIAMPTNVPPHGSSALQLMQDDGYRLLIRMFPRWQISVGGTPVSATAAMQNASMAGQPFTQPGQTYGLQFRGVPIGGKILDGNQSMAFFFGGPTQQGFDPSGPYPPNGNTKLGPWYDFQEARFTVNPSNSLPWYSDPWGNPYAFFSCGSGDTYAPLQFPLSTAMGGPGTLTNSKGVNTNTFTTPYRSGSRWINPGGVQIISAGTNGAARKSPMGFGPGSVNVTASPVTFADWSPGVGRYAAETAGEDDLANFNNGAQLGASGQ
jgi:hypothetical protein